MAARRVDRNGALGQEGCERGGAERGASGWGGARASEGARWGGSSATTARWRGRWGGSSTTTSTSTSTSTNEIQRAPASPSNVAVHDAWPPLVAAHGISFVD